MQDVQNEQQIKHQDIEISFVNKSVEKLVNIRGHQVGSQWVAVFAEDGSTIIFPAISIAKMVVIVKE